MYIVDAMAMLVTSNGTEKVRARDFNTEKSQSSGALPSQSPRRWTLFGAHGWGGPSSASGVGEREPQGGGCPRRWELGTPGHLRQHRGA